MRANSVAHVDANRSGDFAKLYGSEWDNMVGTGVAHDCMVTLPSLAKMRLSEFVVLLEPTTSGF
jgi:hypothetical protein